MKHFKERDELIFESAGLTVELFGSETTAWHPIIGPGVTPGALGQGANNYPHFAYYPKPEEKLELAAYMIATWKKWDGIS